jgi:type IV pilus assembly protein PilQ
MALPMKSKPSPTWLALAVAAALAPTAASAEEPAQSAPATQDAAASPQPTTAVLSSLGLRETGNDVVIEIAASDRPSCADFTLTSGQPTLVIECTGMDMGTAQAVQTVGNGLVERIEVGESADAAGVNTQIRIVMTAMPSYEKVIAGNSLTLTLHRPGSSGGGTEDTIGAAMAAAAATPVATTRPSVSNSGFRAEGTRTGALSSVDGDHRFPDGGTRVQGVDFQQLLAENTSRVVVTPSGRLDYEVSYPTDTQVVVALRGASLGTGLERQLDTSKYASAVTSISAFKSRKNANEVKLVVNLREKVTPSFATVGDVLVIDFPIPASVAGAVYTAPEVVSSYEAPVVADSAPGREDRIESAIGREKYISTGGQSLDPAKKARKGQNNIFGEDVFMGEVPAGHQWRGRVINIDLVSANIHNVFRLISNVGKVNVVASDDVEGLVTVRLLDVPWDQALAAVLQSKSLGCVQYGNILRVAPIETIRKERENAAAAEAAKIEGAKLGVLALPLNYAGAGEVMKQLENMLSKRGSVNFDERTNTLIVRDIDEVLQQIRELVKSLDSQTPQVHIQARIVEANSSFTRSLGIQWGGNLNFSPATGAPTGLFFPNSIGVSGGQTAATVSTAGQTAGGRPTQFTNVPNYVVDLPAAGSAGSLGISLGSLTGLVNLDARLTATESAGNGKVIAQPAITTVTNQSAVITDGARIPYETASLRGTNVQFVEALLKLEVTPQITQDQNVFLDIEISRNRPDFGSSVQGLPTIQVKEAKTTVMVADGDTTVIGGVYTYEEAVARTYIPGLGRIPVLGWLFKRSQKRIDRTELLVFITPTILRGGQAR